MKFGDGYLTTLLLLGNGIINSNNSWKYVYELDMPTKFVIRRWNTFIIVGGGVNKAGK